MMNKLGVYLRIKFADYLTASDELKSRVNPDLLERWKWYNDKVTQEDDPDNPFTMQDKINNLDYVRSLSSSAGNKQLRKAMAPDRQRVRPNGTIMDSTLGQLHRSFGRNYAKYDRYQRSDNFDPTQLLGDLNSQNLTDEQRSALTGAMDTIKNTHSVFAKPDLAVGYAVDNDRRALQTQYMKQGYTPDQAFVLAEAENRKNWNANKREVSQTAPVSQPVQPNVPPQQQQPNTATTTTAAPTQVAQQQQPISTGQPATPTYNTNLLNRLNINTGTGGIVGAAAGGIGGGYLGNRASNWATNKLGLTDANGGWRKWLGRGLRTTGTVGGAVAGAYGGNQLGSMIYR